jgi:hypothetical protein
LIGCVEGFYCKVSLHSANRSLSVLTDSRGIVPLTLKATLTGSILVIFISSITATTP